MPSLKKHAIPYTSETSEILLLRIYVFALCGNKDPQCEEVNWVLRNKLLNGQKISDMLNLRGVCLDT